MVLHADLVMPGLQRMSGRSRPHTLTRPSPLPLTPTGPLEGPPAGHLSGAELDLDSVGSTLSRWSKQAAKQAGPGDEEMGVLQAQLGLRMGAVSTYVRCALFSRLERARAAAASAAVCVCVPWR